MPQNTLINNQKNKKSEVIQKKGLQENVFMNTHQNQTSVTLKPLLKGKLLEASKIA